MAMDDDYGRSVKGIFIPIEIWETNELTLIEKIIFAEIDSFTANKKKKECIAGNEWFGEICGCSATTASKAVNKLKAMNLISVRQDGRKRHCKSNLIYAIWTPNGLQPLDSRNTEYVNQKNNNDISDIQETGHTNPNLTNPKGTKPSNTVDSNPPVNQRDLSNAFIEQYESATGVKYHYETKDGVNLARWVKKQNGAAVDNFRILLSKTFSIFLVHDFPFENSAPTISKMLSMHNQIMTWKPKQTKQAQKSDAVDQARKELAEYAEMRGY